MNLDEYLKLASHGAPITIITPIGGGPIVAHCWESAVDGRRGWEYVLADYHGKILGQAWTAGGIADRDSDVEATIAKLKKRIAAATSAKAVA